MLIQRNQPESSYECIDPVEDAKLLGDPNTGKANLIKTGQVEYDMVNKKKDTKVYNNAKLLKKKQNVQNHKRGFVSLSVSMWISDN